MLDQNQKSITYLLSVLNDRIDTLAYPGAYSTLKKQVETFFLILNQDDTYDTLLQNAVNYINDIINTSENINSVRVWNDIFIFISMIIKQKADSCSFQQELIVEKCHRIVYELLWRKYGLLRKEQMDETREISNHVNQLISGSSTFEDLKTSLNLALPIIEVESLCIIFYEEIYNNIDVKNFEVPERGRLVYEYSKKNKSDEQETLFSLADFLPENIRCNFTDNSITTVHPLHYFKEHYGYLVMNYNPNQYSLYTYGNLVESINSALKVNVLINELQRTRKNLVQSEKMAALGTMLSGVSHEINNPLNYIATGMQALDLIYKDLEYVVQNSSNLKSVKKDFSEFNKTIFDLLKNVNNGIDRTSSIVQTLQTFYPQDGSNTVMFDIHDSIETAINIVYNGIEGDIRFIKDCGTVPKIAGYPGRMTQLFINVLKNSIEAVLEKEDDRRIYIKTVRKDIDGQDSIEITISNNGPLIAEEILKQIFNPFFTTKNDAIANGLGLSIAFSIAEEHGGTLAVHNSQGVVNILSLPVRSFK